LVGKGLLEIESNHRNLDLGFDFFSIGIFYYLVMFFPLFEELSFRLFLNPKEKNIRIGFSFLFFISIFKVINQIYDLDSLRFILTTGSFGCALLLSYFLKGRLGTIQNWFKSIKKIYLLIISSFIFALMHYDTNYSSDSFFISLIPLLKHFFSGMIFGIFRIRYGFKNGFILHALNNMLSFLAIFFY
jgi:membrane protease YdiL (CAAX protease family)